MASKKDRKVVTIKQVAEQAGVSVGTVSNYLNGTTPVSEKAATRIKSAIKELHFVPNAMASSLRRKTSRMIDVLVPNMNNSFYTGILSPFTNEAHSHGYNVRIFGYEYSAEREKRMLESVEQSRPGALIVFSGIDDDKEIRRLVKQKIPVILADRDTEIPGVPCIAFENEHIFDEMIEELTKKGYRRIGVFMEQPHLENIRKRFDSCLASLKAHGFGHGKNVIFSRDDLCFDHLGNSYRYMKELLRRRKRENLPDVWITSSDLLAIGIVRALHEEGYHVPGDFGVVGFDNIAVAGYVQPRLSTVEQSQEAFGNELWRVTEQVLSGKKDIRKVVLPQRLILRESF